LVPGWRGGDQRTSRRSPKASRRSPKIALVGGADKKRRGGIEMSQKPSDGGKGGHAATVGVVSWQQVEEMDVSS
jgi:hypothetical protein